MTEQPRWPRGAPDDEHGRGQGGRFRRVRGSDLPGLLTGGMFEVRPVGSRAALLADSARVVRDPGAGSDRVQLQRHREDMHGPVLFRTVDEFDVAPAVSGGWLDQVSAALDRRAADRRGGVLLGPALFDQKDPDAQVGPIEEVTRIAAQQPIDVWVTRYDRGRDVSEWQPVAGVTVSNGGMNALDLPDGTSVRHDLLVQWRPAPGRAMPAKVLRLDATPYADPNYPADRKAREETLAALGARSHYRLGQVQRAFKDYGIDPVHAGEYAYGVGDMDWEDVGRLLTEFAQADETSLADIADLLKRLSRRGQQPEAEWLRQTNAYELGYGFLTTDKLVDAMMAATGSDRDHVEQMLAEADSYDLQWWDYYDPTAAGDTWLRDFEDAILTRSQSDESGW